MCIILKFTEFINESSGIEYPEDIPCDKETLLKLMSCVKNGIFRQDERNLLKCTGTYNKWPYIRTKPPIDFEIEHNINGISKEYNIPYLLKEDEFENLMDCLADVDEYDYYISKIYNELVKLNPELSGLDKIDSYKDNDIYSKKITNMLRIIGGVCSGINESDIIDCLINGTQIKKMPNKNNGQYQFNRLDNNKEYDYKYTLLYKKGYLLPWLPSIETMDKILSKI